MPYNIVHGEFASLTALYNQLVRNGYESEIVDFDGERLVTKSATFFMIDGVIIREDP